MKLTPEQLELKSKIRLVNFTDLVTNILKLKVEGYTHKQIADELGYSVSYINQISRQINNAE